MSFFSFFAGRSNTSGSTGVEPIFPLALPVNDFIRADILATYQKILTDTVERAHGIPDAIMPLLWDNCVQSENQDGLITLLSRAMTEMRDLCLIYKPSVGVLREANFKESEKIRADYKANGESADGVFISFKNYRRTDMLRIYSALEHCVLASLHKTVNVSKAVQIKMSDMRSSVALADAGVAIAQATAIADALRCGQDILLDVKDNVTTATPDVSPTEKAIGFLDAKRAFCLGLPLAYVSGLQTGGIGSTGEADMRAVERGLKQFFLTIIHPVLLAVFGVDTEFKSLDFRQMASALEALKTFDLVSDEYFSKEAKTSVLSRMFELDEEEELAALALEAKAKPAALPPAN